MEAPPVEYEPHRKFQHRYVWHVVLFLLTILTTTFVGWGFDAGFRNPGMGALPAEFFSVRWFLAGLNYSVPLLMILGAHEFGHYWYCRKHDVDASLPYFLPAPPIPVFTGTLGAVIRIKEAFPSTRALFDIGVSGPIAGFVVLVPFLYWGIGHSTVVTLTDRTGVIFFGEPLLLKAIAWWHFGTLPSGTDITLHPVGFAAWFGMLATALNLLPFGQLDGGHIAHAVFGPRARFVSIATLLVTLSLTFASWSWLSMAIMMLVMAFFLGVRHPRVIDDGVPLDAGRRLIALAALVIFVISFTPVPIEIFIGD